MRTPSDTKLIVSEFAPRWYQLDFFKGMQQKKRAVLCWARRHGKDLACWNFLIQEALSKKGVYYYIFPEYSQARKALWDSITEDGIGYTDFIPKVIVFRKWNHEMKIKLINGSIIQVIGSDNTDAIRGGNPCGVVFSEYAYQNPNIWKMIVDPILTKNGGWAVFNSTPNGRNHFYDLFIYAEENKDEWFASKITANESKLVSAEDIERKKSQGFSEDILNQEWFCSFESGVVGSFYGKYVKDMEKQGRIGYVPYDKNLLVYTAWDLGFTDSMSIIFYQKRGNEILIIDCYENQGYHLSHYLELLRSKDYIYGSHYIPFDGKMHDRTGSTFVTVARDLGYQMTVLPKERSIFEGIERVRGMFPRFFIDKEKADYLVRCLIGYHAEFDEKAKVYQTSPKHNFCSHMADACRYLTMAVQECSITGMSKEKLTELKRESLFYEIGAK